MYFYSLADLDYVSTQLSFNISHINKTQIVSINILDDSIVENYQDFSITMSARNLPENVHLERTEVVVTIYDNDGKLTSRIGCMHCTYTW